MRATTLALLSLLPALPAAAANHNAQELRGLAEQLLEKHAQPPAGARLSVTVTVDPRLSMPACPSRPEAFLPPTTSRVAGPVTVGIRCQAPAWTVYLNGRVQFLGTAFAAARPLARGEPLGPDDLRATPLDLASQANGYFPQASDLTGRTLRFPVAAGTILSPAMLISAPAVKRGQPVVIESVAGGIAVRAGGEALKDGAVGDRVAVRNRQSRTVVEGLVTAPGVIRAGP
jgi:flagella basal body P-ring formation protein FlgA